MNLLRKSLAPSAIVLLLMTQQSPAPISEIDTPTPTQRRQAAKPRPKSSIKPKPEPEASASASGTIRQQVTKQSHFAGTWVGTMPVVPWGNIGTQLVIDPSETTMSLVNDFLGGQRCGPEKIVRDSGTLHATFLTGAVHSTYSLTPEPDGKTARVRLQGPWNDQAAIFHRVAE